MLIHILMHALLNCKKNISYYILSIFISLPNFAQMHENLSSNNNSDAKQRLIFMSSQQTSIQTSILYIYIVKKEN